MTLPVAFVTGAARGIGFAVARIVERFGRLGGFDSTGIGLPDLRRRTKPA